MDDDLERRLGHGHMQSVQRAPKQGLPRDFAVLLWQALASPRAASGGDDKNGCGRMVVSGAHRRSLSVFASGVKCKGVNEKRCCKCEENCL